jgi:hypothetical protein
VPGHRSQGRARAFAPGCPRKPVTVSRLSGVAGERADRACSVHPVAIQWLWSLVRFTPSELPIFLVVGTA